MARRIACDAAEKTILHATLDMAYLRRERQAFDPAGHDRRPELFRLEVDARR